MPLPYRESSSIFESLMFLTLKNSVKVSALETAETLALSRRFLKGLNLSFTVFVHKY